MNVYDALQERLKYIFDEFENVYVAFSGGKDSGVLLNLVMDFVKRNNITKKVGLFHQDMEAQYQYTTDYVIREFEKFAPLTEPYWFCQPIASRTAVGNQEMFWYPWDDEKEDLWIRQMPTMQYVYNLENNPFEYYKYKMDYQYHAKAFGRWYRDAHGSKKTITLLGLRADESLHRYSGIVNKKYDYKGKKWITSEFKDVWSASPMYDWETSDIWIANYRFDYDYNRIYDMYYKAGMKPHDMRVASPFHEDAKNSLNMYRVIEPQTWIKLVGRVQGANFAAIYGKTKAMGYREVQLPTGHTWKSYTKFLLETLPENIRNNYIEKFKTSIRFWYRTGGGFAENVIKEIEGLGYGIKRNGVSNYSKDKKSRIVFPNIPDHTDDVKSTLDIPSWKRMAFCILKNDHMCKFMGFGLSRAQEEKKKAMVKKYKAIL